MYVEIFLKENGLISISDLTLIATKNHRGESKEITDFNKFFLSTKTRLSFIGKNETLTLNSDDILYVKFCN